MRQIDDAHDPKHKVQPEPDQGEVEPEYQPREDRVQQHAGRLALGVGAYGLPSIGGCTFGTSGG